MALLQDLGALVVYDHHRQANSDLRRARLWISERLGRDWAGSVIMVRFPAELSVTDGHVKLLSQLPTVETVHLDGLHLRWGRRGAVASRDRVTDESLNYFRRMPHLRKLMIRGTSITPDAIAQFREDRPQCTVIDSDNARVTFLKI